MRPEGGEADKNGMAKVRLAALYEEAAGGFGPYVVARGKSGTVVRRRAVYRRTQTPDQKAQASRMTAVAALWNALSDEAVAAWKVYAAGLIRRSDVSGREYAPGGYNAFAGLAMTLLRMDPGAAVPAWPPVGGFGGDGIGILVAGGSGAVRFVASGPNRAGVATELLLQRLVNARRTPTKQYKGLAFVAFAGAGAIAEVPVEPGAYACAHRFVERATGRAGFLQTSGIVVVG